MRQAKALDQLTHEALELPTRERAKLAHILINSIDEQDEDAASAWDIELEKRINEIKSGKVTGIPAGKVFAKIEEKYF